ncbi:hypothetical protein L0U85_19240 [Glycomyces sp. L485]|uniref:hypothetical protein n=1 Tax=Glycomyces sp. L485 TaxID=2909235 RepID=UPI001F4A1CE1|nr:hypothetical protein [Glycomyces sp. L485]MCH7232971.1 hypothetical protein [Glycomyces sp. L485]
MNTAGSEETPPEREFDQSTAWERLEEAAAEAIADLPDFPGFEVRTMKMLECEHDGEVDEKYVNLELGYQFSRDVSDYELVREAYRTELRALWEQEGYDIHRDAQRGDDPPHYSLEARRPDGINYWYRVAGLVELAVQSGCVKAIDGFVAECPDPLGGVTEENDRARDDCIATDTTYSQEPSEAESDQAIAPFRWPARLRELRTGPCKSSTAADPLFEETVTVVPGEAGDVEDCSGDALLLSPFEVSRLGSGKARSGTVQAGHVAEHLARRFCESE